MWWIKRTREEIDREDKYLKEQYEKLMDDPEYFQDQYLAGSHTTEIIDIIVKRCRKPRPGETGLDYSRRQWGKIKRSLGHRFEDYEINSAKELISYVFNQGWEL